MKFLNKKLIFNQAVAGDASLVPLTDERREALKAALLGISADVDRVCRKHGLKLFLVGGSLLGAVRHGGFIPWDDDVDFGLTRGDYEKLIAVFESELGGKYMMRCPNSPWPNANRFMQIFKKGTILETAEGGTPLQPNCAYIDIFPYDYAPANPAARYLKGLYCNALMLIAASATDCRYGGAAIRRLMSASFRGRVLYALERFVGALFSWQSPAAWFDALDLAVRSSPSPFICCAMGRGHYFGEILPADVLLPLQEMKFEHLRFYAHARPERYLQKLYGPDYMTPPPESERESHFIKKLEL